MAAVTVVIGPAPFRRVFSCYHPAMFRVVLAALLFLAQSVAHADITGKPRVIDGDTIEIAGERIRLHGIDAPESKQTCTDADGNPRGHAGR